MMAAAAMCSGWPASNAANSAEVSATTINAELLAVQGHPADIGGYYRPDEAKAAAVMRPSKAFTEALTALA